MWKFFSLIIIFRGLFLFTVPNVPYLNIKDWTFRCAKPSLKSSTETKGTWATRFLFASESYRPNVFLDVFKRWWVHGFWTMLFSSRNRISAALNRDHIRTVSQFITHFRCGFFSKLKVTDSCLVVKNNLFFKNIF